MARTQFINVPDELKNLEAAALERRDRFTLGVVQAHKRLPSKKQAKLLKRAAVINSPMQGRGSLFKYLAPLWGQLTTEQKNVWKEAAAISSLTNWQLFVSDNAARIRNSLSLVVPPSTLWQVRAGRLLIESPADELILKQEHPLNYYVAQKIVGQSWKRELVNLTENFSLPLEIGIRYKSNLTAVGGTQIARYRAEVWTSFQGQDIKNDVVINFSSSADWTLITADTTGLPGILIGYTLYLEIVGYRGELLFDNIRAIHGGTNWALDPRCDAINTVFKKAFAVVPPFWIPVSLPTGSSFQSDYPPALS
jgi:hypothetical protein